MDIRLALMSGVDIPVPECQVILHQPRIREIAMLGENDFNTAAHLLCLSTEDWNQQMEIPEDLNSFNILMRVLQEKEAADKKQMVKIVLSLVLPKYQVLLTPRSIICNGEEENLIIDEGNFEFFQKILRKIFCIKKKVEKEDEIPETYNPANEKAKKIAEKLYAGRKKLNDLKENKYPDDSALSRYFSILAIGLGYTPEELNDLTLQQLMNLAERYTMKIRYDMIISVRLAGGKPDEQPDNWMGPLQ